MVVHVQIRNVPEELARALKARAAAKRQSLSEFLLGELEAIAATPSLDDFLAERRAQPRRVLTSSGADAVAAIRRERSTDA